MGKILHQLLILCYQLSNGNQDKVLNRVPTVLAVPDPFQAHDANVRRQKIRMKKMFLIAGGLSGLVMIIAAADFRPFPHLLDSREKCTGYTIIEYDKGIDCHGDTIKLVRKYGFAERVIE